MRRLGEEGEERKIELIKNFCRNIIAYNNDRIEQHKNNIVFCMGMRSKNCEIEKVLKFIDRIED